MLTKSHKHRQIYVPALDQLSRLFVVCHYVFEIFDSSNPSIATGCHRGDVTSWLQPSVEPNCAGRGRLFEQPWCGGIKGCFKRMLYEKQTDTGPIPNDTGSRPNADLTMGFGRGIKLIFRDFFRRGFCRTLLWHTPEKTFVRHSCDNRHTALWPDT